MVVRTAAGRSLLRGGLVDHPGGWPARGEAAAAAAGPVAPPLRWRVTAGGWDVLAHEHRGGHPADLSPWSGDLPAVVEALNALGPLPSPAGEVAL